MYIVFLHDVTLQQLLWGHTAALVFGNESGFTEGQLTTD